MRSPHCSESRQARHRALGDTDITEEHPLRVRMRDLGDQGVHSEQAELASWSAL